MNTFYNKALLYLDQLSQTYLVLSKNVKDKFVFIINKAKLSNQSGRGKFYIFQQTLNKQVF